MMDDDMLNELIGLRKERDRSAVVAASAACEYFNSIDSGMTGEAIKLRLDNLKEMLRRYREASYVYYDWLHSHE